MTDPAKLLRMSRLLDVYGELLTERQLEFCRSYYEEDRTLAEVSERAGVSRQAVHDAIKTAEAALEKFEQVLGLLEKTEKAPLPPAEPPPPPAKKGSPQTETVARELQELAVEIRRQGSIYDVQPIVRRLEDLAARLD